MQTDVCLTDGYKSSKDTDHRDHFLKGFSIFLFFNNFVLFLVDREFLELTMPFLSASFCKFLQILVLNKQTGQTGGNDSNGCFTYDISNIILVIYDHC